MRGVVSFGSSIGLPMTIENGKPFPGRDLILFSPFV